MKVVFDMDTGVDDSLALIYALNRPAYEIHLTSTTSTSERLGTMT